MFGWYYPSGGIHCCQWYKFVSTNCFLYEATVYKRHGNNEMESTAGVVTHCHYKANQCPLKDGSFLMWKSEPNEMCEYLKWQSMKGIQRGISWLFSDGNFALTFSKTSSVVDCRNNRLEITDQAIPVRVLRHVKVTKISEEQAHLLGKCGMYMSHIMTVVSSENMLIPANQV